MGRLTIEDLKKIKEKHKAELALREGGYRARVTVHMGTCGIAAGARDAMNAFMTQIREAGLEDVMITTSGCAGLCSREPMATVQILDQPPVKYGDLDPEKIAEIVKEHLKGGQPVGKYALVMGSESTY